MSSTVSVLCRSTHKKSDRLFYLNAVFPTCYFARSFLSSWHLLIPSWATIYTVYYPTCLLPSKFISNAFPSTRVLYILFTWPNYYSHCTSNFINKFWIPVWFPKIFSSFFLFSFTISKIFHILCLNFVSFYFSCSLNILVILKCAL